MFARLCFGVNDIIPTFHAMSHQVAVLIFPDFQLLDASGPTAVFEAAGRYRRDAYQVRTVAGDAGLARSSSGLALQAEGLAGQGLPDTLLVAGGEGVDAACRCPQTLTWIQRCEAAGCRVASVCTGAFLLAEAGLLAGRRATTHWAHAADFARRYPNTALETDRLFIREGRIWTAAGVTAGIDLALALVADDLGAEVARQCAQRLVVYCQRPGGQSQFSSLLEMQQPGGRFAGLLDHVRRNLGSAWTVAELAERSCLSPRHFSRLFLDEVGASPAKAVEQLRVEAARGALESGERSLQSLARQCGFGEVERMRRSFLRVLGHPPSALKR